jgi:hypothetical protein
MTQHDNTQVFVSIVTWSEWMRYRAHTRQADRPMRPNRRGIAVPQIAKSLTGPASRMRVRRPLKAHATDIGWKVGEGEKG